MRSTLRLPALRTLLSLCALALISVISSLHAQSLPGAGTEVRQWLPERARVQNPQQRFPMSIQDDVSIAVRNGTKLDARLFLPALAAGAAPTPCVLLADGCGRASNSGAG